MLGILIFALGALLVFAVLAILTPNQPLVLQDTFLRESNGRCRRCRRHAVNRLGLCDACGEVAP